MPQITITSSELARSAYQLIRIIDDNDTLSATQLQTAVWYLNQIVSFDEQRGATVPYYQILKISGALPNLIPGQGHYTVSNNSNATFISNPILQVENAAIILTSNTQWPLTLVNRDQYYNNIRPQITTGQPFYLFYQQENSTTYPNSSFFEVWPLPDQSYPIQLSVKLSQDTFVEATTINAPGWYIEYLQYSLAFKLGERYKIGIWDDRQMQRFKQIESFLFNNADQDYTVQPSPALVGSTWVPLSTNQPFP